MPLVEGNFTQLVQIEVSNDECFNIIKKACLDKLFSKGAIKPGEYINQDGMWEEWEDTGHGSGWTHVGRAATETEKKAMDALATIDHLLD